MYKIKFISAIILIFFLSLNSCKQRKNPVEADSGTKIDSIPAVCIWDGLYFRNAPSRQAAFLSTLNLGESMVFLGQTVKDSLSDNLEYLNVVLSDGTVGWAAKSGIITGATPAVVTTETPLYKRPDLLTISDKRLKAMDVVAVCEKDDDWVKVAGERNRFEGWIKNRDVSRNKEDIALAVMSARTFKENEDRPLHEVVDEILKENPYPNSVFVSTLRDIGQEDLEKNRLENTIRDIWH